MPYSLFQIEVAPAGGLKLAMTGATTASVTEDYAVELVKVADSS
jgi:hypothetical protein